MFQLTPVEFPLINYTDFTCKGYVGVLFFGVLKTDQFILLQEEDKQGCCKQLTAGMEHTPM
jgi:hypothetical protein